MVLAGADMGFDRNTLSPHVPRSLFLCTQEIGLGFPRILQGGVPMDTTPFELSYSLAISIKTGFHQSSVDRLIERW